MSQVAPQHNGFQLTLSGWVQGVGFRPTVWRIAQQLKLKGEVLNNSHGVLIRLLATEAQCQQFLDQLTAELPPLARIDQLKRERSHLPAFTDFQIQTSQAGEVTTGCVPDAATCQACRAELFDPTNRRYRYPFINCTHCGPRLSIIRQIPYDRASTTMAGFTMCPRCQAEYDTPTDRRFHAQPNACAECGPNVWLEDSQGSRLTVADLFVALQTALKAGQIIAIKGLGGFHLACDATNPQAVDTLRQRKQRPDKPFALMARDLAQLSHYVQLTPAAEQRLTDPAAPVVLMDAKPAHALAASVAPKQTQLGFMLPYTPIHQLLLADYPNPLVMTSGNRAGMPQAIDNQDAREQLAEIADRFLLHDRPIHNRVDDSVVRASQRTPQILRRARGYAPTSLPLPAGFKQAPALIALGAELKNTLCLLQAGRAILSQHLGDLEDAHTYQAYEQTLALYQNLYQHPTQGYVCDLHPEYLSSKFGQQQAEQGVPLTQVQHHHAHLAACLGENGYPLGGEPVLGICLDGTGYGNDHTLWGGEFLLGGYQTITRIGHLTPFPLVGGAQAIREPWRCLFAQLCQQGTAMSDAEMVAIFPQLAGKPLATLRKMIEKGLNAPTTSSAGRLFDAVAAALNCHPDRISYEGQAAIELENLAHACTQPIPPYAFQIDTNADSLTLNPAPVWPALITDLAQHTPSQIAHAFHQGFLDALCQLVGKLRQQYPFTTIALSGGVMQNRLIQEGLIHNLESLGYEVLIHKQLPPGDGCIAFGQALVGAARRDECCD